jgi:transposase-like protein
MHLDEFSKRYPDEQSCIEAVKTRRLSMGLTCKKCSHTEHYFRKGDLKFECKKCHSRQGLRAGTVMENTNLPIRYWLMAIHLMSVTKKGFSALEMQRLIGHKRYEPIWYMMHKIRRIMGKRDDKYQLSECIEIDEGFFERVDDKEVITANKEKNPSGDDKPNKRGRGSEKQTKVLVMVESKPSKEGNAKGKPDRKAGYLKMKVMDNLKADSINTTIQNNVKPDTTAQTDGYRGYNKLKEILSKHTVVIEPDKKKAAKLFPWVNRTISNAKKVLLCNHHNGINNSFVQNYLDEFCYKFNRRYFGDKMFDRLVLAALETTWY